MKLFKRKKKALKWDKTDKIQPTVHRDYAPKNPYTLQGGDDGAGKSAVLTPKKEREKKKADRLYGQTPAPK